MRLQVFQELGLRAFRVRIRTFGDAFLKFSYTFPLTMGVLLSFIFRRHFRRAYIHPHALQQVHRAHAKGNAVYVLQDPSYLDVFCLSDRLEQEGLKPIHLAPGLAGIWYQPFTQLWRYFWANLFFWLTRGRPPHSLDDGLLRLAMETEKPMALFLRMNRGTKKRWAHDRRSVVYGGKYFPMQEYLHYLIRLQERQEKPIFLITHVPIWETHVVRLRRNLQDFFFGTLLKPSFWRRGAQMLFYSRKAELFFPEIINLKEFLAERREKTVQATVKDLRKRLYQIFEEKHLSIRGPKLPPRKELLKSILEDPQVRAAEDRFTAKSAAKDTFDPKEERVALRYLREMAGDYRRWTILLFERVVHYFLDHNSEGLVYDLGQLEKVREAVGKGSVLLLPNHRSHLDYFLISYIFFRNKMMTPYICAGDNLNFWPAGPLFRRSGAYFIRRSFDESTLYPSVLNRYLRSLLRSRVFQELFIEGGRSRTGKMRPPMLGIFSLLMKTFFNGSCKDLILVPIALTYDRVPEDKSYAREMRGAEKRLESFKDLQAIWRLRKENFGRVYISIGEPISCKEYCDAAHLDFNKAKEHAKRKVSTALAYQVSELIQRQQLLTPSSFLAMILLSVSPAEQNEIEKSEVLELTDNLVRIIERHKREPRIRLFTCYEDLTQGIERAIDLFQKSNLVEVRKGRLRVCYENPDAAFLLDYYRNTALHCFVSHAILATVLATQGERNLTRSELLKRGEEIQTWISRDFPVKGELTLEEALKDLADWRLLSIEIEQILVVRDLTLAQRRLRQIGDSIAGLLQAHLATTETVLAWVSGEEDISAEEERESQLVRRVLKRMEDKGRPEARSWFHITNALHHLADVKLLQVRNQRRGKHIFRSFSLPEGLEQEDLCKKLQNLRSHCVPVKPGHW